MDSKTFYAVAALRMIEGNDSNPEVSRRFKRAIAALTTTAHTKPVRTRPPSHLTRRPWVHSWL